MSALSVIIGEARPFVREGLLAVLSETPGVVVVGTANAPTELLRLGSQRPDAAIIGTSLDQGRTPELVGQFAMRCPTARIIVLDCDVASCSAMAFPQAGALCCLAADATPAELLVALRVPGCADTAPGTMPPAVRPCLTAREREVAGWIATGHTSGAIAAGLGVSLATVITHRTNLYRKLAVHSVGELVTAAIQQGLLATPGDGAH